MKTLINIVTILVIAFFVWAALWLSFPRGDIFWVFYDVVAVAQVLFMRYILFLFFEIK